MLLDHLFLLLEEEESQAAWHLISEFRAYVQKGALAWT